MYKWIIGILTVVFCGALATICLSEEPDISNAYAQPTQVAVEEDLTEEPMLEETLALAPFQQFEQAMIQELDVSKTANVCSWFQFTMDGDETEEYEYMLAHYEEYFSVDSIKYGSFTGSGQEEALVIFSIVRACHAEGFDKKLLAVYDVATGDLILQHPLEGDNVDIVIERNYDDDYVCIIMTGYWQYIYNIYGTMDCGSLEGGVWTSIAYADMSKEHNTAYAYNSVTNILTTTEVSAGTEPPEYSQTYGEQTEYLFDWDTKAFVLVE